MSAMRNGRRLGIDVGEARIGVASCDPSGMVATPVETVVAGDDSFDRLAAIAANLDVTEVVVGWPVSLSGGEGPSAQRVRSYAERLAARVNPIPVRLVDERLTTVSAERVLRERGRKAKDRRAVVDQVAAVEILQGTLDAERSQGTPPGEVVSDSRGS